MHFSFAMTAGCTAFHYAMISSAYAASQMISSPILGVLVVGAMNMDILLVFICEFWIWNRQFLLNHIKSIWIITNSHSLRALLLFEFTCSADLPGKKHKDYEKFNS